MIKQMMISLLIIFSVLFIMGCATDEYYVNNVISNSYWEENDNILYYKGNTAHHQYQVLIGSNDTSIMSGSFYVFRDVIGSIAVYEIVVDALNGASQNFRKARGTPSNKTSPINNDIIGGMVAQGFAGTQYRTNAGIRILSDGNMNSTSAGGKIDFQTRDPLGIVTGQPTSRMTIMGNGNVGIATSSPSEKLHVIGNAIIEGNLNVTGCVHYNGGTLGVCI